MKNILNEFKTINKRGDMCGGIFDIRLGIKNNSSGRRLLLN